MVVRGPFSIKGSKNEMRTYARAIVRIADDAPPPPFETTAEIPWSNESDYWSELERHKDSKQNVRLGPLFNEACNPNCRHRVRIRWGEKSIETIVPLPSAGLEDAQYPLTEYLTNPAFLDSLHQAGAVLAIELTGHVYLPISAEQFVLYTHLREPANYRVVAKLKQLDEQNAQYDMIMVREDGVLCAAITNSTFRRVNG